MGSNYSGQIISDGAFGHFGDNYYQVSKEKAVYDWISPLEPVEKHQDVLRRRTEILSQWIIEEPRYLDWRSLKSRKFTLWCQGSSGSGETFICSSIIEDLMNDQATPSLKIGLAYFYCDHMDQNSRSLERLIGALVKQLLRHLGQPSEDILDLYSDRWEKRGFRPTMQDLQTMFRSAFLPYDEVFICINGIDECRFPSELLELLKDLGQNSSIKLLLLSQSNLAGLIHQQFYNVEEIEIVSKRQNVEVLLPRQIDTFRADKGKAMDDDVIKIVIEQSNNASASMSIDRAFTLLRCQHEDKQQHLTNVAEAQQILLRETNLSARTGCPIPRNHLRILHHLTITERKLSIDKDLDDGTKIEHLDQAKTYVKKALSLAPQSGIVGAQEQLKIEWYIIKGLRAYFEFRKGAKNAESKRISLRNAIAGMGQAWENLEKVDVVKYEENRDFVWAWVYKFEAF